eukprot:UN24594
MLAKNDRCVINEYSNINRKIRSYLPIADIFRLRSVCKRWHDLSYIHISESVEIKVKERRNNKRPAEYKKIKKNKKQIPILNWKI